MRGRKVINLRGEGVPSRRRLACAAALVLCCVASPQRAPAQAPSRTDARAALLNPRHKLWKRKAPDVFHVKFETGKGSFVVEVRRDWAPRGADRLYNLVRAGFFDDSRFFRVRAGFVAQFGIPGDPAVAAVWRGRAIPDDPARRSNTRGSVAYAMTGPDTRTTQLFVNLADNSRLDAEGFEPVGVVVEGMDVVDRLYAGYGERPMAKANTTRLYKEANAFLDAKYPKLERIRKVTIRAP